MSVALNNDPGAALYTDSLVIPEAKAGDDMGVDMGLILAPFDGADGPCGPSLRYETIMDEIREAG
ncbi:MAG: hypothetical protein ACPGNT_08995, partial [Rhodospirillales bacterium]